MDIVEIQAIYYMMAATGVLIAAVFYVLNLQAQRRNMKTTLETRQAQLFMPIYSMYCSDEFIRAHQERAGACMILGTVRTQILSHPYRELRGLT